MRKNQKIGQSRALRKNLTSAERLLWNRLRNCRLNGRKFRRQHTIGQYIVDFCCLELSLIVELDGGVHAFQAASDAVRQKKLEELGYRVVRFTNRDIFDNLSGVLRMLWDITRSDVESTSPQRPHPDPLP